MPSRSMEVSRISPAPYPTSFLAWATASMPVALRPPWVKISIACRLRALLASMAATMHWLPNFSAASRTNSGRLTAAVLIETLSAPGQQQGADVFQGAHAAAHGQRHETDFGGAPHHIQQGAAIFMAGGDVQEAKFVGARRVIDDRLLDRIAGIAQAARN